MTFQPCRPVTIKLIPYEGVPYDALFLFICDGIYFAYCAKSFIILFIIRYKCGLYSSMGTGSL